MTNSSEPKPAGTVVLLREQDDQIELLMVKRNANIDFFGDHWVFPGGKIEASDRQISLEETVKVGTVRELYEEAGVQLAPDQLALFAHWTTPPAAKKRYATWFFVAAVTSDQQVKVDDYEITEYRWDTPDVILEAHRQGQINIAPPTFIALQQMRDVVLVNGELDCQSLPAALWHQPAFFQSDSGDCLLLEDDDGHEAIDINEQKNMHRLWMRPEGWEYIRT